MVSVIIPYYVEPYLDRTIESLKDNAGGSIEIIPVEGSKGMRAAINEGILKAQGQFIMKIDAHCIVGENYDQILSESCEDNWLVVPRRYSLDEETWTRDEKLPKRDYHYLCYPGTSSSTYGHAFQVQNWPIEGKDDVLIDDTMIYQGSSWMANRWYFINKIGLYDDNPDTYGWFAQDQAEIGLKYWLGGGAIKVNKKTWYAHLQKRGFHYKKGMFSHRYKKDQQRINGNEWATKHWMNNEEPNMLYPFSWLIEKFWPVPTWPEDRNLWRIT